MRLGFYVTICFTQLFVYVKANEGKYTVIAPGSIHSNEKYTVAVAVHHTSEPCTINVSITGRSYNKKESVEVAPNEVKNVEFDVPYLSWGSYYLTAEGVNCLKNFKNRTELFLRRFNKLSIIRTDKGVYKLGDDINFRVLFMDKDLKPVEPEENAVIWFEDGNHKKIKESEKKRFTTINGVYTGKFTISELHAPGYWRMMVKNGDGFPSNVMLLVDNIRAKYVAKVEAPETVSIRDGVISVAVTANHVSGKPLDGKVTICLSFGNTQINKTANMIEGIFKIDIDVEEYKADLVSTIDPTEVKIEATVEEQSTNEKITVRTISNIYPYKYLMYCVNFEACWNFEVGKEKDILFQVTHLDGTYLNDTTSTVELTYIGPTNNSGIVEGYMNEAGFVNFKVFLPTLPPHDPYNSFYTFKMKYLDEECEVAKIFQKNEPKNFGVETAKVEGEYFILMNTFSNNQLHLNKAQQFTVNSSQPLSYFNYNVIGRGNILQSGHVDLPDKPKVYNLTLTPQPSWAMNFAVYVYYVDENGEYHYDEKKYHINEPLNPPGENVTLKIRTSPNSFVGLMAVNQRVSLLEVQPYIFKYLEVEKYLEKYIYSTYTPYQGPYLNYPSVTSGCVTLTNADYLLRWDNSHNPHLRFIGRTAHKAAATVPSTSVQDKAGFVPVDSEDANSDEFLKTWIFADFPNTESDEFNVSIRTPDIATTWVLTAFSLNPSTGLGVAEHEIKITTF